MRIRSIRDSIDNQFRAWNKRTQQVVIQQIVIQEPHNKSSFKSRCQIGVVNGFQEKNISAKTLSIKQFQTVESACQATIESFHDMKMMRIK